MRELELLCHIRRSERREPQTEWPSGSRRLGHWHWGGARSLSMWRKTHAQADPSIFGKVS